MKPSAFVLSTAAAALFTTAALAQLPAPPAGPTQPAEKGKFTPPPTPAPGEFLFGEPRLEVEAMEHDFGRVLDTQETLYKFKFKNSGVGPLTIHNVNSGCGCTVPALQKREYAAGESGEIEVRYHPKGRQGPQTQQVTVTSNDPGQPEVRLTIKANVVRFVTFEPGSVSMPAIDKNKPAAQIVRATALSDSIQIASVRVLPETAAFTARVIGTKDIEVAGEKAKEFQIEVAFKGSPQAGFQGAQIQLNTNDPKSPMVQFSANAMVQADLQVTPAPRMTFVAAPGTEINQQVTVTHRLAQPFEIRGITLLSRTGQPIQGIEATLTPGEDRKSYTVTLKGTPAEAAARIDGEIMLATNVPGEEQLKIQVLGVSRTPAPSTPIPATQGPTGPKAPPSTPQPIQSKPSATPPVKHSASPAGLPGAGVPGAASDAVSAAKKSGGK